MTADDEPPTIRNCPAPITVSITDVSTDNVTVRWPEPTVTDNTELYSLVQTRRSGDRYVYTGRPVDVVYTARDTSNNENRCVFQVNVLGEDTTAYS